MSALIPRRATTVALDASTITALGTVSVDNFPATQTVDGEVSLDAATLAALENTSVTVSNQLTQPLTDTELRASPVQVLSSAVHDTGNSTTTPLGSNAVFLGAAFDLTNYASWSVNVFTDQDSATNGFKIEWSDDGTNWDYSDDITYEASAGNMVTFGRKAHYVRFRFTNGAVAQGVLRVEAVAQPFAVRQTRKFIGDVVKDQDTGQVVIAAIQGKTTGGGGGYVPVKVSPSGALVVDTGLTQALTDTQLRASAVPVSLASVPSHAVTNAGTFAVQVSNTPTVALDSASLSALETISISGTVPVSGTFWQATQPVSLAAAVTDGGSGKTLKSASFSLSATGSVVSAVASKRIKVYAVKLIVSAAISVNFRSGGATALEGAQPIAANGGFIESVNPPAFLFGTTAGESLDLVISGTGTASGRISYWDDDNA